MQLIVDGDIIRLYQLLKVLMNVKSHRMPLHLPAWGYGYFAAGLFMFCSRTVTGTKVDLFKLFLFIFVVPCGSLRKFPISEWRWEIQCGPSGVNRGTRDGGQEPALSWGVAGQHCPRLPSTVCGLLSLTLSHQTASCGSLFPLCIWCYIPFTYVVSSRWGGILCSPHSCRLRPGSVCSPRDSWPQHPVNIICFLSPLRTFLLGKKHWLKSQKWVERPLMQKPETIWADGYLSDGRTGNLKLDYYG